MSWGSDERLKKAESDMGRRKAILVRVKSGEITLIEAQDLISKSSECTQTKGDILN